MNSVIKEHNLVNFITDKSKPSDHSILSVTFQYIGNVEHQCLGTPDSGDLEKSRIKRYYFDSIPELFMKSQIWKDAIATVIYKIEDFRQQQDEIDDIYKDFCKVVFDEMDRNLKWVEVSKQSKKSFRKKKPYWNATLTAIWTFMTSKEKLFLKFKGNPRQKRLLRAEFKQAQMDFDRQLKRTCRDYNRNLVGKLDEINTKDPKQFWNTIKRLGPRKSTEIPMKIKLMKIYLKQGIILC